MILPAYTLEDLIALALPYDVDVMQVHESNRSRFNIIGEHIIIRVDLGDHETDARSEKHKLHSYYALRGVKEDFVHPHNPRVIVRCHNKKPITTAHIEEVLSAATFVPNKREVIPTINLRDRSFQKTLLYGRQSGKCFYCEKAIPIRDMNLDHMTPLVRGGQDHPSNLCGSCYTCNNEKGSMTAEEFKARLLQTA